MPLSIRYATYEDAQAVLSITIEAFTIYAHELGKPELVYALSETPYDVGIEIERKHVLLAFIDDKPVGSVRFEILGDVAYVSRLGVFRDYQKFGVGKALINHAHTVCESLGVKAAALHTSSRMFALMRFYYGSEYFVHSTSDSRGYIRALLVHEFVNGAEYDLTPVLGK